jgi:hypothetical protein
MAKQTDLEQFTAAYIETLLWSSVDVVDGEDVNLDDSRFETSDAFDAKCKADCAAFFEANLDDLIEACIEYPSSEWPGMEMAGHDFALTRNGHGVGFWDRGLPEALGDRLTAASKRAGEVYPYVGDDGLIYV